VIFGLVLDLAIDFLIGRMPDLATSRTPAATVKDIGLMVLMVARFWIVIAVLFVRRSEFP